MIILHPPRQIGKRHRNESDAGYRHTGVVPFAALNAAAHSRLSHVDWPMVSSSPLPAPVPRRPKPSIFMAVSG
jgi:hypothetical protein